VYTVIPVSAGLIQTGAPVRFHGVKVGEITSIDAGAEASRVGLTIDSGAMDDIPSTSIVRVVPRTFFGDINLQLLATTNPAAGQGRSLEPGDTLVVDDGPDAVNLYDIFTKMSSLINEVQPDQINVALAAMNRAIGGRGTEVGVMIDDWWAASQELETSINRFIDATPEFRRVAESLRRATPDIIATLDSVTSISRGIAEHGNQLAEFFAAASGFVTATGSFVAQQRANLITVLDSTGKILATVAENPQGITRTVQEASKFGAAGTILFANGRFNITAVPTFSQPMPYTAADCPTYRNDANTVRGAQCFGTGSTRGVGPVREPGQRVPGPVERTPKVKPASDVVDGSAEAGALGQLQGAIAPAAASDKPNAATTLMLGPMVRGNQVVLR
ncbi:MAG: MCE family protein, partial [Gordonia sp. (in: high G+C Gram-positive bacteria)]|uniref:MCE family protein n=1 Tax=Gordonia sp. (in: high G+C Gram-positive bacteria) TaxID=84139 RepID=UPI003BB5F986